MPGHFFFCVQVWNSRGHNMEWCFKAFVSLFSTLLYLFYSFILFIYLLFYFFLFAYIYKKETSLPWYTERSAFKTDPWQKWHLHLVLISDISIHEQNKRIKGKKTHWALFITLWLYIIIISIIIHKLSSLLSSSSSQPSRIGRPVFTGEEADEFGVMVLAMQPDVFAETIVCLFV